MGDINRVTLLGRLGQDPHFRETKTGGKMVQFAVATSTRRVQVSTDLEIENEESDEKNWESVTDWHPVVAWGRLAEISRDYLKKGCTIFLEGRILNRVYENKEGQKRRSYEIIMDEFNLVRRPTEQGLPQSQPEELH